jgi:D-alanyl-lipoteichoic acid acyltransferase DltB (MBOAT superfamily)
VVELDWIAWVFIVVGIACFLLAILGSHAGRKKHRTGLAVYMGGVAVVLVLCVVLFTACWVLTEALDNHMDHKSDKDVQRIPCDAELHGCCCCDAADYEEVPPIT